MFKRSLQMLLFILIGNALGLFSLISTAQGREFYLVDVSPDEQLVAAVAVDMAFHIFDARTGELLIELQDLPYRPLAISWSPDSTRIAGAGGDNIIRVWCVDIRVEPECSRGALIARLEGHLDPIGAIAWGPNDVLVSSGQLEALSLRTWDMNNYVLMDSIPVGETRQFAWSPDGSRIMMAGYTGLFTVDADLSLDPGARNLGDQMIRLNNETYSVEWNFNEDTVAVGTDNGMVHTIDPNTHVVINSFEMDEQPVYELAWDHTNTRIAASAGTGNVHIWDTTTGERVVISNQKALAVNLQIDWTATTGLLFADDTGNIVGLAPNQPPLADAGSDQVVTDFDDDGFALVRLNAAESRDEVVIVDYVWTKNGEILSSQVAPFVCLSVGEHVIALTTTDDDGANSTDQVVITVNSSVPSTP